MTSNENEDAHAKGDEEKNRRESPRKTDSENFFVVGIGASAGGLKALENFFKNMPENPNMAFVVIQHLDPRHESHMPELLKSTTSLALSHIEDNEKVKLNRVYFKPAGKGLLIEKRRFKLTDSLERQGIRADIDKFFRSMAQDIGDRAVGVILSGAGSDGSLGVKEIKGQGGLTMVQDEDQADYASMPHSAVATGMVDFVLPVEKMGKKLVSFIAHPVIERQDTELTADHRSEQQLLAVLKHIRIKTGCDFSKYKRSTLRRRIARRMAANQIEHVSDYERYLRDKPDEVEELFKDMLINVTSFFRDKPVFETLHDTVMRELVSQAGPEDQLRVWVPGCATGEEAYSLAMLLTECMDGRHSHIRFKIFATDINKEAIAKAREGVYPQNIAADVSAERLKRFFVEADAGYRVEPSLRERIIFAVHDLTREPPFSKVDLVSCRNLLIYMEAELQRKVLPLLHYSLKPHGYLMLGTSEGIGNYHDLFETIDKKNKIFQRREDGSQRYLEIFDVPAEEGGKFKPQRIEEKEKAEARPSKAEARPPRIDHQVLEEVMPHFDPPALIVDNNDQVAYFMGNTSPFLVPPVGAASFDLRRMIREDLHYPLLRGMETARNKKKTERVEGVRMRHNGQYAEIDIEIKPMKKSGYMMISFEGLSKNKADAEAPPSDQDAHSQVDYLQHKLDAVRQELQATIEELETSNEELKSANEELQANNEELQSTNEELESSKEELQSTNEELETINQELHKKNDELSRAEDDIKNLFASTHVGVLFLDEKLKINRFTPTAASIFSLREEDRGRFISDITHKLRYENFLDEARDVIDNLNRKQLEVQTKDGRWLEILMQPYRSSDNVIEGVVATFKDITRIKESNIYTEGIMDTLVQPLVVLTEDLKVVSANRAFYNTFDLKPEQIRDRPIGQAGKWQWDQQELQGRLKQVITKNRMMDNFALHQKEAGDGEKPLRLTARRIDHETGSGFILLMVEDAKRQTRPS